MLSSMHRSLSLVLALLVSASAAAGAERKLIRPAGYNRGLPFTPGILVDGTLYIAGFSGEDPQTGAVPRDFETEVKQALEKIGVILKPRICSTPTWSRSRCTSPT